MVERHVFLAVVSQNVAVGICGGSLSSEAFRHDYFQRRRDAGYKCASVVAVGKDFAQLAVILDFVLAVYSCRSKRNGIENVSAENRCVPLDAA